MGNDRIGRNFETGGGTIGDERHLFALDIVDGIAVTVFVFIGIFRFYSKETIIECIIQCAGFTGLYKQQIYGIVCGFRLAVSFCTHAASDLCCAVGKRLDCDGVVSCKFLFHFLSGSLFDKLANLISCSLVIFRRFVGIPNQCDGICGACACVCSCAFAVRSRRTVRICAAGRRTANHCESQNCCPGLFYSHVKNSSFHNLRNTNPLRNFRNSLYLSQVKFTSKVK